LIILDISASLITIGGVQHFIYTSPWRSRIGKFGKTLLVVAAPTFIDQLVCGTAASMIGDAVFLMTSNSQTQFELSSFPL
jgi:hypothetical protein